MAGLGVILDWVPAHFPTDEHGLARFDGTALYEHRRSAPGLPPGLEHRRSTTSAGAKSRNFLIANALYWLDRYHIDGLRCDAVASMLYLDYSRKAGEWLPNADGGRENLEAIAFLQRTNELAYGAFPGRSPSPRSPRPGPAFRSRSAPGASVSASSGTWAG